MDIGLIIFLSAVAVVFIVLSIIKRVSDKRKEATVNEWSYKRYADFYGQMELADPHFVDKITIIKKLIDSGEDSIDFIAEEAGCTTEECIMKINYLKNKRVLDNCYINRDSNTLCRCSKDDMILVDKYKSYIYGGHLSLDELIATVPTNTNDYQKKRAQVIRELKYLIDNNILNGVIFNEVDNKLIYYTVEKHNKEKDFITLACPQCGALNDVNYNSKKRCRYCENIIVGPKSLKEIKK